MFGGWELRMSHSIIVAVGKGIDRAQGMAGKKRQVRLPLTWALLAQGRQVVLSMEEGGYVTRLGLAVSYFLCAERQSCGRTQTDNSTPSFG